ncbi:MAG: flagellar biosynthetic protein FliO [Planctomycetes bacterium]|nr:flagellar biosynthetic protein FliO [Planctomycetota bacterium]
MRKSNRSRQGQGWLGARLATAFTLTAILLTACFGHPAVAAEPDEQIPSTSGVASNQQIELGAGDTGSRDDARTARGTGDQVVEKSDRTGAVPGSSVMRRHASLERTTPFDATSTPWYRSGLVALMIVLGIVWLAYWAVRRWMPTVRAGESDVLRIVARTTLAPKQHLALIRVGRQFVLIGVSPDRVDRLCVIDDAADVSELVLRTDGDSAVKASKFDEELVREVGEYGRGPVLESVESHPRAAAVSDRRPSLTALLDRLRTLQTG